MRDARRGRIERYVLAAGLAPLLMLLAACGSDGPPTAAVAPPGAAAPSPDGGFSGLRVQTHVERLVGIGARNPGSRGIRRARTLIRGRLEQIGAELEERRLAVTAPADPAERAGRPARVQTVSLLARLEGESPDVILLAAAYDTPERGIDEPGEAAELASGAALLLELADALARAPRRYTLWLLFIEGDGLGVPAEPDADPAAPAAVRFPGSAALAAELRSRGELEGVRLAVFFDRLAGPALVVARDLRSHRVHREAFWESARALAADSVFPADLAYESAATGHLAFIEAGLRRVVAISGTRHRRSDLASGAADEPPGPSLPERGERALQLETVGLVTLDAVERITLRLSRIDHFARSPLEPVPDDGEAEAPASGEVGRERDRDPAAPPAAGSRAPAGRR